MSSYTQRVLQLGDGAIFHWNSVDFVFAWLHLRRNRQVERMQDVRYVSFDAAYNHRDPGAEYGKSGAKPLLLPMF